MLGIKPGGPVTYDVCIQISYNENSYFSSEIIIIFLRDIFACELSFTFCDLDTVAFLIKSTVVIHQMLTLIS